ncbi:acyl- N-acyltransferase [Lentinula edodes]|uniref:Glucosamine 6-phosphate N-acetyltransferase n=1 Tax=Lentinula edodes TaxID=5353 RepID=A0A1Q3ELZ4_LENED|nr:acyl- N-acyltransferase [Lentinula edodes]
MTESSSSSSTRTPPHIGTFVSAIIGVVSNARYGFGSYSSSALGMQFGVGRFLRMRGDRLFVGSGVYSSTFLPPLRILTTIPIFFCRPHPGLGQGPTPSRCPRRSRLINTTAFYTASPISFNSRSTDYHRGHLAVLSVLTVVSDSGHSTWLAQFHFMRAASKIYYPIVIVSKQTDQIVVRGCVFIERKFLRGLGSVGYIEDTAVHKSQQARAVDVTTILNCSNENIPFYEKCGFQKKENETLRDKRKLRVVYDSSWVVCAQAINK